MRLKWERFKHDRRGSAWRSGLYKIIRWYAADRGNQVPQYQVEHGPQLISQHVVDSLAKAKRIAEDHAQLQEVRAARLQRNPRRGVTRRARGRVTAAKVVRDCGGAVGLKRKAKYCRKVKNRGARVGLQRMKQNPDAPPQRELQDAVQRFTGFRGTTPERVDRVPVPKPPRVLLHVGEVLGIMYRTERDGEVGDYLHEFRKKSRPTLAVTSDGKTLYLLGGAYRVTDHGIEDA